MSGCGAQTHQKFTGVTLKGQIKPGFGPGWQHSTVPNTASEHQDSSLPLRQARSGDKRQEPTAQKRPPRCPDHL